MIKVAVTGAASPSAGELLRLFVNHPDVTVMWLHSPSHAGLSVTAVHRGLIGETYLRFSGDTDWTDVDLLFTCPGTDRSMPEVPPTVKVIDLTGSCLHTEGFVYALPELNRKALVRGARHAVNPGAEAAAVALSLLPAAKEGLMAGDIAATVVAGTAGDAPAVSGAPLDHPAAAEAADALRELMPGFDRRIDVTVIGVPRQRGVIAVTSVPVAPGHDLESLTRLYEDFFSDHSFTFISRRPVDLNDVAHTNKAVMSLALSEGRLVVTTVADTFLKGSAGNAVHCMNLMFGLQERVGLSLKSSPDCC